MNLWKVLLGPNVQRLKEVQTGTVQTCVSSPPYWSLRDYGTGTWEGGDPGCDHEPDRAMPTSTLEGGKSTQGQARIFRDVCEHCGARRVDDQIGLEATPDGYVCAISEVFAEVYRVLKDDGTLWLNLGDTYCSQGGVHAGRDDNQPNVGARDEDEDDDAEPSQERRRTASTPSGLKVKDMVGIPWRVAFALQGFAVIPARTFGQWADDLAAARAANDWQAVELVEQRLRASAMIDALTRQGWYLRADVIWSKPNPMPESVTDRPTKAHEYFFLFAKSGAPLYWSHRDRAYSDGVYAKPEPDYRWKNQQTREEVAVEPENWRTQTYVDERGRSQRLWRRLNLWRGNDYYYDAAAIFEAYAEGSVEKYQYAFGGAKNEELFDTGSGRTRMTGFRDYRGQATKDYATAGAQNPSDTKRRILESMARRSQLSLEDVQDRLPEDESPDVETRTFEPRKNDEHPTDRRKQVLNDWTNRNRDPLTGNARREPTRGEGYGAAKAAAGRTPDRDGGFGQPMTGRNKRSVWTVATQPYREAHFATYPERLIEPCILAGSQPGDIVMDVFNGSGTTGVVATGHNRHYLGFELNPKYDRLSHRRISAVSPLFTREAVDLQELLEARRR